MNLRRVHIVLPRAMPDQELANSTTNMCHMPCSASARRYNESKPFQLIHGSWFDCWLPSLAALRNLINLHPIQTWHATIRGFRHRRRRLTIQMHGEPLGGKRLYPRALPGGAQVSGNGRTAIGRWARDGPGGVASFLGCVSHRSSSWVGDFLASDFECNLLGFFF